jgi:hypothetical protein
MKPNPSPRPGPPQPGSAAEERALGRLAQLGSPPPARQATLSAVYARAGAPQEQPMSNLFSFLRGRPWYAQAFAAVALCALFAAAVIVQPVLRGGQVPGATAYASSQEYALVCENIGQVDDAVHEKIRRLVDDWTAERNAAAGGSAPTGRFIEAGPQGVNFYLVYLGAARADLEDLQQRMIAIAGEQAGGASTRIVETTVVFPKGLPALTSGVVQSANGRIFCFAGDGDEAELHRQLQTWLHEQGADLHGK